MTNNIKYQKKIKNIQRMMLTWAGARPGENRDLPDDWKLNVFSIIACIQILLDIENSEMVSFAHGQLQHDFSISTYIQI